MIIGTFLAENGEMDRAAEPLSAASIRIARTRSNAAAWTTAATRRRSRRSSWRRRARASGAGRRACASSGCHEGIVARVVRRRTWPTARRRPWASGRSPMSPPRGLALRKTGARVSEAPCRLGAMCVTRRWPDAGEAGRGGRPGRLGRGAVERSKARAGKAAGGGTRRRAMGAGCGSRQDLSLAS